MFISREKVRAIQGEIDCLKAELRFTRDKYWELWHKIEHIHAYLKVAPVTTPEKTELKLKGEAERE